MRNPYPVAMEFPPFLPGHPWDTAQLLLHGKSSPCPFWIPGGFGVQAPGVSPPCPHLPAEFSCSSVCPSVSIPCFTPASPSASSTEFLPAQSLPLGLLCWQGLGFLFLSLCEPQS